MVYFITIISESMVICLIVWAIATRNIIPKEWFEAEDKLIVEVEREDDGKEEKEKSKGA